MKPVFCTALALCLLIAGPRTFAANSGSGSDPSPSAASPKASDNNVLTDGTASPSLKARFINSLPPWLGDGLELDAWGWFSDLQNNQREYRNFYDAELSLGVTKSFNQRFALSAQGNFIDANGTRRGEIEQGYGSFVLSENQGSFLTVGKFNANFGAEGRDFWNRTTGTTSLIFGAQPQDLVGVMLTQPVGETGVKLRPFLTEDFQGQFYFNQPPYGGLNIGYQPTHELSLGLTGMIGPGIVLHDGRPIHSPYPRGDYGDSNSPIANWQGPNLVGGSGGTMCFVDAKAIWQVRPDLRFSTEFLEESTSTSHGSWGWFGFLVQADYDVNDRLHFFARWSYLDDADWLVTGVFQRAQEVSGGAGYLIADGLELRGEFRHDMSSATGNVDGVSIHLTFTY